MSPEEVVSSQLNAYNKKDIDTFIKYWSDDAEYYAHPNTLLAKGKEAIRERHLKRFEEPDLFGKLEKRVILGTTVVDYETVTRNFPEGKRTVDVICIYQVGNEKITKGWFLLGEPRIEKSLP